MTDSLSKSLKATEHELSWANRGLRGDSAENVKELCDAIEQCSSLLALRLEGNTINEAAATAIGQAIQKHPEIQRLIWNDLFTTRLKTEVPPSLIKLTQGLMTNGARIVEINLSDNAFGPIGVEGLKAFLSSPACFTLEELRLNNCGMGIGGAKLLAEALIACHQNSIKAGGRKFQLKQFIAGRNRLENEGAQALAKAFEIIGTLEVIRVPQNGIRPPGIEALANAFVQNPNLRVIDLNDNIITLAAGRLASAIEKLPKLEIINLESSLIRTHGASVIARGLISHKNLKELYLGCNDMHTEGGLEIARIVKNMNTIQVLDLNGNCFGPDGIEEIRQILEEKTFSNRLAFSDDEGSDDEENGEENEDYNEEEEEDEEEDDDENDDDYEDDEDGEESPSFFFGKQSNEQPTWNSFQFGVPKTPSSQQESTGVDLSSMIANFNVCSPFNFGAQATSTVSKLSELSSIEKTRDHLKADENSIERAVKVLDDLWNDSSIAVNESSNIAKNVFQTLALNSDRERRFNEQLLICLGFVKDEQTGRTRRLSQRRDRIFQILFDAQTSIPKSTKNLLAIFLQNTSNEQSQCSSEIKQKLISSFKN